MRKREMASGASAACCSLGWPELGLAKRPPNGVAASASEGPGPLACIIGHTTAKANAKPHGTARTCGPRQAAQLIEMPDRVELARSINTPPIQRPLYHAQLELVRHCARGMGQTDADGDSHFY